MDNLETAGQEPPRTEPLNFERLSEAEQLRRSVAFYETMRTRRTVREFSSDPVPYELIENAIKVAASAPSGANQQPWRFVVVSNPEIKREIREAAEIEETEFYNGRAPRRVAGSSRRAGHKLGKIVPGNCSLPDRHFSG